ncbi:hypothetical protein C8R45DRAFT_96053 [Mycena sanguinolenta]|nr:hypothetical protein C8R45DRAFT_96053 [Mycena sanguinolenta]
MCSYMVIIPSKYSWPACRQISCCHPVSAKSLLCHRYTGNDSQRPSKRFQLCSSFATMYPYCTVAVFALFVHLSFALITVVTPAVIDCDPVQLSWQGGTVFFPPLLQILRSKFLGRRPALHLPGLSISTQELALSSPCRTARETWGSLLHSPSQNQVWAVPAAEEEMLRAVVVALLWALAGTVIPEAALRILLKPLPQALVEHRSPLKEVLKAQAIHPEVLSKLIQILHPTLTQIPLQLRRLFLLHLQLQTLQLLHTPLLIFIFTPSSILLQDLLLLLLFRPTLRAHHSLLPCRIPRPDQDQ